MSLNWFWKRLTPIHRWTRLKLLRLTLAFYSQNSASFVRDSFMIQRGRRITPSILRQSHADLMMYLSESGMLRYWSLRNSEQRWLILASVIGKHRLDCLTHSMIGTLAESNCLCSIQPARDTGSTSNVEPTSVSTTLYRIAMNNGINPGDEYIGAARPSPSRSSD